MQSTCTCCHRRRCRRRPSSLLSSLSINATNPPALRAKYPKRWRPCMSCTVAVAVPCRRRVAVVCCPVRVAHVIELRECTPPTETIPPERVCCILDQKCQSSCRCRRVAVAAVVAASVSPHVHLWTPPSTSGNHEELSEGPAIKRAISKRLSKGPSEDRCAPSVGSNISLHRRVACPTKNNVVVAVAVLPVLRMAGHRIARRVANGQEPEHRA